MPPLKPTRQSDQRREKLRAFAEALPQAQCKPVGHGHLCFAVGKKTFAYYMFDHHGDGRICVCAKAAKGRQQQRVRADPDHYEIPAYLGKNGWVSLRLDRPKLDWNRVHELLIEAYRLQAPRRLAAEME
jgi:hypothetical protein